MIPSLLLLMPHLVGAVALISLVFVPQEPVPRIEGIEAVRFSADALCETGELSCWRGYYTAVMDLAGVLTALQDLKARTLARESVDEYCHELLHDIGARAYTDEGSLSRAYMLGDPFCRAGFYHGVLEGAFGESGEELLDNLDALCARMPGKERYSYTYFSCVHGIGHGLMAFFSHDLFASLDGCARLRGEWEVASCAGGVFMENVMAHSPETPSRFLKEDDLVYPCNAVDERFRDSCFMMQTSHALSVLQGDFVRVFALCNDVTPRARQMLCFESLGRDAAGYAGNNAQAAAAHCAQGHSEARLHCMIGAAVDYVQTEGADFAENFCDLAEESRECHAALAPHIESL